MNDAPPSLDFKSKEEFRAVCQHLSRRLHYLNRVAMGEQRFVWEMADLMARAGRVFDDGYDDPVVQSTFGDGWTSGTIAKDEQNMALMALLYPEVGSS